LQLNLVFTLNSSKKSLQFLLLSYDLHRSVSHVMNHETQVTNHEEVMTE